MRDMNDGKGTVSELFLCCYGIALWNGEIGHRYEIVPSASADISGASAVPAGSVGLSYE
jgi:hypothetical protein